MTYSRINLPESHPAAPLTKTDYDYCELSEDDFHLAIDSFDPAAHLSPESYMALAERLRGVRIHFVNHPDITIATLDGIVTEEFAADYELTGSILAMSPIGKFGLLRAVDRYWGQNAEDLHKLILLPDRDAVSQLLEIWNTGFCTDKHPLIRSTAIVDPGVPYACRNLVEIEGEAAIVDVLHQQPSSVSNDSQIYSYFCVPIAA